MKRSTKRKKVLLALLTIALPLLILLYIFIIKYDGSKYEVVVSGTFDLKPGDILFQDLDCGASCDAIEAVTDGVDGSELSHIAVVSHVDDDKGKVYVIESLTGGVQETTIDKFLGRSFDDKKRPKVLVGRLNDLSEHELDKVVQRIRTFIGKPYDDIFNANDDKYYCSELVYEVFRKGYRSDSEPGKPIFKMEKMTFNDPKDGKIMPVWKDYFGKLSNPIPEGKLGINPGSISKSKYITIMHAYGCPDGWSGCPDNTY